MGSCCSNIESLPRATPVYNIPDELESRSINIKSFTLITVLGRGSFGQVLLMEKKDTEKIYAIKVIHKRHLLNSQKKNHALMERKLLAQITSPFVVKLRYAFQNSEKLYLVLDFLQGGDLYYHLSVYKQFPEDWVRFYAVEIILALKDLHANNIIYRDLKPENILMDKTGHIKLADFNLAATTNDGEKTNSICGTPEYVSPEVLRGSPYGFEVDFWALGCVIYEMIEGRSPFYSSNYKSLYTKIINGNFRFSDIFSLKAMDLISQLLSVSVKSRLTNIEKLKKHDFFANIDWEVAYNKKMIPPIVPEISSNKDTRYFMPASGLNSPNIHLTMLQRENNDFPGFTYEESLKQQFSVKDSL